jgi:hypothetical protein
LSHRIRRAQRYFPVELRSLHASRSNDVRTARREVALYVVGFALSTVAYTNMQRDLRYRLWFSDRKSPKLRSIRTV